MSAAGPFPETNSATSEAAQRRTPQAWGGLMMTETEFQALAAQGYNRIPLVL